MGVAGSAAHVPVHRQEHRLGAQQQARELRAFTFLIPPTLQALAARVLSVDKKPSGVVSLLKAELASGPEKLGSMTMAVYCASRNLACEVWVAAAANRAGLTSIAVRRAVGVLLSSVTSTGAGPENSFDLLARSLAAQGGADGLRGTLAAMTAELATLGGNLTEEQMARGSKPSKTGYDVGVTDAILARVASAAEDAVASLPAPLPPACVAAMVIPSLRAEAEDNESFVPAPAAPPAAKKGFGGAAAAAPPSTSQRLPDFGAVLKKGGRPARLAVALTPSHLPLSFILIPPFILISPFSHLPLSSNSLPPPGVSRATAVLPRRSYRLRGGGVRG